MVVLPQLVHAPHQTEEGAARSGRNQSIEHMGILGWDPHGGKLSVSSCWGGPETSLSCPHWSREDIISASEVARGDCSPFAEQTQLCCGNANLLQRAANQPFPLMYRRERVCASFLGRSTKWKVHVLMSTDEPAHVVVARNRSGLPSLPRLMGQ